MFVSDGTGVTAETIGLSVSSQFTIYKDSDFDTRPFVNTESSILKVCELIESYVKDYSIVTVFSTIAQPHLRKMLIDKASCKVIDLFATINPIISSQYLTSETPKVGLKSIEKKNIRVEAIDYALSFDDGKKIDYNEADIILLGLSRTGKTPTCLWLAMHYGLKAANYPITSDNFQDYILPSYITKHKDKCLLLISGAERLSIVRQERRPNSVYSSLLNCKQEINSLNKINFCSNLPKIDVSNKSVEEVAACALDITNIHPKGRF